MAFVQLALLVGFCCNQDVHGLVQLRWIQPNRLERLGIGGHNPCSSNQEKEEFYGSVEASMNRRQWFVKGLTAAGIVAAVPLFPTEVLASPLYSSSITTSDSDTNAEPRITDRIFLTIKGLPRKSGESATDGGGDNGGVKTIVIGLYGDQAPKSAARIKDLVTNGLQAPCKPLAKRTLQKEQLEANKVHKNCKEGEDIGVSLRYSTIWRIIPGLRVDLGAVTGRFVAREYPNWDEDKESLPNDMMGQPGIVSVRRGAGSGFGITISTGAGKGGNEGGLEDMKANHIIVGRVIEGLDVVKALNEVPVIATAKQVNYMSIAGGNVGGNAPNRSCRYGGPMYCNENKPLVKLTISEVGIA